jgi:gluconate kinase
MSGSGKSAVLRELSRRGFEAHGVDEEGYADWVSHKTGMVMPFPHDDPALDVHHWFANHRWVLSDERIEELKAKSDAEHRPIFLTGVAEGDRDVWHHFDKVIVLSADAETIKHRIETRQDNHYGKSPEEMANIMKWLEGYDDKYLRFGAVLVDAKRPLAQVVDEVVEIAK